MVQSPGSRSRRSGHREPLSTMQPPRATLDGPATGEPLSTVRSPGSRSQRSGNQRAALNGLAAGEPLRRQSSHRGIALNGPTTGKLLRWSNHLGAALGDPVTGSRSRRSRYRGVALDGMATMVPLSMFRTQGSLSAQPPRTQCLQTLKIGTLDSSLDLA